MAVGPRHGSLRNLRFKVSVSVSEEAHPETVLVIFLDISRSHADGAVARVVVNVNQVLDDIHPPHGAAVRQLCPYPGLDTAVESLYHGHILLALTGKVLNTMALHQGLKIRIDELLAIVDLYALRVALVFGGEHLTERRRDCFCVLRVDRNCRNKLGK